ncbi:hypothetical protein D918_03177 [Trichuris suis]|nr:hypothetical protein D918_03177 [Trichuris suis]
MWAEIENVKRQRSCRLRWTPLDKCGYLLYGHSAFFKIANSLCLYALLQPIPNNATNWMPIDGRFVLRMTLFLSPLNVGNLLIVAFEMNLGGISSFRKL